ncbi:MAG: hypothetical protein DRI36_06185 [Caldiserica bacterium]|mgnify:CR=1 FL=1|nr:MAG: hypothetical protein DRI36_06185 [Caldisericota bacterium]
MPIDKKLIVRKLSFIEDDIVKLKEIAKMKKEDFLKDIINQTLVERYLERIIGRMIDINYHVLTETGNPAPKDYYTSFIEMGKKKFISFSLSQELAQFAGLRNIIAHEYNSIDYEKLWKGMRKFLKIFPEYLKDLNRLLKR